LRAGPCIYIPQEQGGPVIPPGTGYSASVAQLAARKSHNLQSELSWGELYYDRRSVGQSVLVSSPHLGLMTRFLLLSDHRGFLIWGALSDKRRGLSFSIYNVQYTIHFTVSDLTLPQPGGPGPCIYIPQEQAGPVITPGTGFIPPPAAPESRNSGTAAGGMNPENLSCKTLLAPCYLRLALILRPISSRHHCDVRQQCRC
jgi:hypothetical protein